MIHGEGRAREAISLHAFGSFFQDFRELLTFLFGELSEHEVDLMPLGEFVAHSDPQTGVVGVAKFGCNVFQSVVSGIAASLLKADASERKGKIIDHDQKILEGKFLLVHPESHGYSAKIHECGWLQQEEFAVLDFDGGHIAVSAGAPGCASLLGESVDHHKSCIVASSDIIGTYVAESDYQISFHIGIAWSLFFGSKYLFYEVDHEFDLKKAIRAVPNRLPVLFCF